MNKPNFSRTHLHLLALLLESWYNSDTPDDIYNLIGEIISLCDKYIDKGYSYIVVDDGENYDCQEIDIF